MTIDRRVESGEKHRAADNRTRHVHLDCADSIFTEDEKLETPRSTWGERPANDIWLFGDGQADVADSESISRALNAANQLRDSSRLPDAKAAYEAVLLRAPNNAWARNGLGQVLRLLGDAAGALAHFEAAAAAAPEHISFMLDIANVFRDCARFPEAEATYRTVLKKDSNNAWACNGLGQVLGALGDHTGALAQFKAAAEIAPENLGFKLDVANVLRDSARLSEAGAQYRVILDNAPNDPWAHNGLGQVLRALGDRLAALAQFEAAVASDPSHIGFRLDLANLLRDSFRFTAAIAEYRRVLEKAPQSAWALNGIGQVLRAIGDQTGALAHFEAAAAADPHHLSFKLDVVLLLRDLGRFAEAGMIVDAILVAKPDSLDGLLHRGALRRWRGDHQGAIASFNEASQRHPKSIRPLIETAIEERLIGRPDASLKLLERALELDPSDLWAMMELAEHRWLEEDIDRALTLSRRAMLMHPNSVWPYLNTCRALSDLGLTEEALQLLNSAEASLGRHPDLVARRISVLRQAGEWPSARSAAQDGIAVYPGRFALWQQLVEIDLELGNRDHAIKSLANAPTGSVRDAASVAILYGKLCENQWQLREAAEHYERAIMLNPECGDARAALARLSLLQLDVSASRRYLQSVMDLTSSALIARGHTLRASQSHLGQFLNEFELDQEALRRLISIRLLEPVDRLPALRHMVLEHPDYTPAAVCLFIALRQAGFLLWPRGRAIDNVPLAKIPIRIIQYWDSKVPPDDVKAMMDSWSTQNPDAEYVRFDDISAQEFLMENSSVPVLQAYQSLDNFAQKADIFRLAYLFARGGIYADADDRAISSIKTIVPAEARFVACQEEHGTIGNNLLASAPESPVIGRALSLGVEAVNRGDRDMIWLMTGPGLLTRAAARVLSEGGEDLSLALREFVVLEPSELRRAVAPHRSARYKRTKSHWLRRQFSSAH
jgi:tetratricopeptide (TPR) repeat protein